jgi:uncharacterized phage protein (TIGR01671 family)
MRETKFRAWDKHERKLISHFTIYSDGEGLGIYDPHGCEDQWYDINNFILMQFTGLKDKNGKDIYEGDICNHLIYKTGPYKVIYTPDNTGYDLTNGIASMHLGRMCELNLEIIGNIYENPELLK